ncbi:Uncharacterised protein [Mycobacterium tuberculosis]|nr:Uncharacterised protein [Mycobacterium tuberculosis]
MVGSVSPASKRRSRSTIRQCVSATSAPSSRRLDTPSQIRTSRVPRWGEGLISQRISSIWSMMPVFFWSYTKPSNSAHL